MTWLPIHRPPTQYSGLRLLATRATLLAPSPFTYCRIGLCLDPMRTSSRMPHPIHFLAVEALDLDLGPVPGARPRNRDAPSGGSSRLMSSQPARLPTDTDTDAVRASESPRGVFSSRPRLSFPSSPLRPWAPVAEVDLVKARGGHLRAAIQCHVMHRLGTLASHVAIHGHGMASCAAACCYTTARARSTRLSLSASQVARSSCRPGRPDAMLS